MRGMSSIGRIALIAGFFIVVFHEYGASQESNIQRDGVNIVGKWYLTNIGDDEAVVPIHRVDFIFYKEGNGYRGAVLLRSGTESPLASLEFDGSKLRLQLKSRSGQPQDKMPWLVVSFLNYRFEGYYYESANTPVGPKLKLVRFPE